MQPSLNELLVDVNECISIVVVITTLHISPSMCRIVVENVSLFCIVQLSGHFSMYLY